MKYNPLFECIFTAVSIALLTACCNHVDFRPGWRSRARGRTSLGTVWTINADGDISRRGYETPKTEIWGTARSQATLSQLRKHAGQPRPQNLAKVPAFIG